MIHHRLNVVISINNNLYKGTNEARRVVNGEYELRKKYNIVQDPSKSFHTKANILVKGQYVKI